MTMTSPRTKPHLTLCHLYPRRMNIYGDRGNIQSLRLRAERRGIELTVDSLEIGDRRDLSKYDLFFFGGGQDQEQIAVAADLQPRGPQLVKAITDGAVLLAVCGGYQLLGNRYRPNATEELRGVGLFDITTVAGPKRLIGNVVGELAHRGLRGSLVGFENHSGLTTLSEFAKPLATVRTGHGNNGRDHQEGCFLDLPDGGAAIGTYLHGSLLPKNPRLTDWLLARALKKRYPDYRLPKLEARAEETAHRQAVTMFT